MLYESRFQVIVIVVNLATVDLGATMPAASTDREG